MGDRFFSQYGEDRLLVASGLVPETGVFVDVGAGDPIRFSNSYWFELHGWTGICVEADPRRIAALRETRRCVVEWAAVAMEEGIVEFNCAPDADYSGLLSGIPSSERVEVPAARLETLLERHGIESIDLLSVDTEGTELEVCETLDWGRHAPAAVVVEYATAGGPFNENVICRYFADLPYRLVGRPSSNLIFRRSSRPRPLRRATLRVAISRARDPRSVVRESGLRGKGNGDARGAT